MHQNKKQLIGQGIAELASVVVLVVKIMLIQKLRKSMTISIKKRKTSTTTH
jgi:hypothetical protein